MSVPCSGIVALVENVDFAHSDEVVLYMAFVKVLQPWPAALCKLTTSTLWYHDLEHHVMVPKLVSHKWFY
jgi:hypothetical protein